MSPKAVPPKLARIARSLCPPQPVGLAGEVLQQVVGDRAELLQIVLDVQFGVVDRLLADDRVEIEPALGHPPAGLQRAVVLGIHEDVAAGLGPGVEAAGHQHGRAVEGGPRLPVLILEAEERLGPAQADHVHAQGVLQVGGDFAQHLIRLDDFDRRARRVELQCLPEPVHAADVHPGDGAAAEVQGNVVGLLMVQGGFDALAGVHGRVDGGDRVGSRRNARRAMPTACRGHVSWAGLLMPTTSVGMAPSLNLHPSQTPI